MRVSILGSNGQPLPVGFPGEMAIAGPGLAEGYIGQSQSTGNSVTDSFASAGDTAQGWNRIYKTDEAALGALREDLPLPRYMVPSMIVPLDRLPTTPNGKVYRRAVQELPLPAIPENSSAKVSNTVVEEEVRIMWKDILGEAAGGSSIGHDTDFFMAGCSSLLLVRLQNALRDRTGVSIPLQDFYRASALRKMAALLGHERGRVSAQDIDWAAEVEVPTHVLTTPEDLSLPKPRSHRRQIALTGGTGFLGPEILRELPNDDSTSKIHCIAVPADSRHKLPDSPRLIIYLGSLVSPSLGLSQREVAYLQCSADQIINAGSQGHCLNNFSSIRQANHSSTRFLATLALPRRIPFQFVSSARLILQSGSFTSLPVSMAAYPPPRDGSRGFPSPKWASECFLESLATRTGLPVTIHRACSVIGARAPHDDAMNSIIRFSKSSRAVPAVPNARGYFDFRDVSEMAAKIVQSSSERKDKAVSFRHHSSGVKVPFGEFAQRMGVLYSGAFRVVSLQDWIYRAEELGVEKVIVSYLKANVATAESLEFPYLGPP
ncbi:hypothetical protein DL765_005125 [Monosporascus sp. GIB2]|nr:hypothetical protein DL765_005125 [Monosporascus sp. GIB2]